VLVKVLGRLAEGKSLQTPEDLAADLGVSPGLVRGMIEELARRGYLEESGDCDVQGTACADCALSPLCGAPGSGARLWSVTEKGQRVLRSAD
jgi:DNA-binding transcriptional MocR family regulator